jgi:hypothetical protein
MVSEFGLEARVCSLPFTTVRTLHALCIQSALSFVTCLVLRHKVGAGVRGSWYWFAWTAIKKYHRQGPSTAEVCPWQLWRLESKIKVCARLVSPEASCIWPEGGYLLTVSSQGRPLVCVFVSFSYEDSNYIILRTNPMTSFNHCHL